MPTHRARADGSKSRKRVLGQLLPTKTIFSDFRCFLIFNRRKLTLSRELTAWPDLPNVFYSWKVLTVFRIHLAIFNLHWQKYYDLASKWTSLRWEIRGQDQSQTWQSPKSFVTVKEQCVSKYNFTSMNSPLNLGLLLGLHLAQSLPWMDVKISQVISPIVIKRSSLVSNGTLYKWRNFYLCFCLEKISSSKNNLGYWSLGAFIL